ncbi:type II secretion system F family protein [Streptomyces sp. WMMB 322]|uniref:type II secretion system F family protein n=1 Tax=Streptomyces sp. WMMB 322 TaxID=1286821 RepID=UPI0008238D27|nr:type II secretion system F family protein [Streptomyces sp. WMMB 322]SCK47545.1 Type II secretion system (T2SS), protein F [Streptomyces sp. WMMB 322]
MNAAYHGIPTEALMWLVLLVSGTCTAGSAREMWRDRTVRRRTRELLPATGVEPTGRGRRLLGGLVGRRARTGSRRGLREAGVALGVTALAVVVIGGVTGWVVAGAGAYGVRWWMRRQEATGASADETTEASAAAEQLPLAAELMAACLAAGSGPAQAADAVGRSLGGPLGIRLIRTATELRLGAEPAAAWAHFASLPGSEGFVRSMERAGTAGAPAVAQVTRLTGELRARRARHASARARRAAVLVTGPLGLCFLPAFLAVGVAPVVMGLAGSLL